MENTNNCIKKFHLKGLECPRRAALIETEAGRLEGVLASDVDLMNQMLTVIVDESRADTSADIEAIKKIVRECGSDAEVLPAGVNRTTVQPAFSGADKEESFTGRVIMLCTGGIMFAAGIAVKFILNADPVIAFAVFAAAYLISGSTILSKAFDNLLKLNIFDVNVLISVSTIAAFFTGKPHEAAAVMLFFRIGSLLIDVAAAHSDSSTKEITDAYPEMANELSPGKTFVEKSISKFTFYFTPAAAGLALLLAVLPPLLTGGDLSVWTEWIGRGCVLLIISNSCALTISTPLAFSCGICAAFKRGVLIKGGSCLEALYKTGIVVLDDTGILKNDDGRATISALNALGTEKIILLSGEAEEAAELTARRLGINEYYADLMLSDKIEMVEKLKNKRIIREEGKKLIAVGDGTDDAPLLARADAGAAVGADISDIAAVAAGIIIGTDELSKLADAFVAAGQTKKTITQSIVIFSGIKALLLVMSVAGLAALWTAALCDVAVTVIAAANAVRIQQR